MGRSNRTELGMDGVQLIEDRQIHVIVSAQLLLLLVHVLHSEA